VLPVDPARLRSRFPGLTDEDLQAYVSVTRRILGTADPQGRSRITREVLAKGRAAAERAAAGESLDEEDSLAVRYLWAMEKMQGRTS